MKVIAKSGRHGVHGEFVMEAASIPYREYSGSRSCDRSFPDPLSFENVSPEEPLSACFVSIFWQCPGAALMMASRSRGWTRRQGLRLWCGGALAAFLFRTGDGMVGLEPLECGRYVIVRHSSCIARFCD
jgi:hypothetical protein